MKLTKQKIIGLGSLAITTFAVPIVATSCNQSLGRQIKELHLDEGDFDSPEFKNIQNIIQNRFQYEIFNDMYASGVIKNSYATLNSNTNTYQIQGEEKTYPNITRVKTQEDANRFFLNEKSGKHGNFGLEYVSWIIDRIRDNILVNSKTQLLLNKISTLYNRNIIVYPTLVKIKNGEFKNGGPLTSGKYMHAEFRADLQSPMKRRFMRQFATFKLDIPIDNSKPSDNPDKEMKRLKAIMNIKSNDSVINITQLKAVLNETIFSEGGSVQDAKHSVIDPKYFTTAINGASKQINLSAGIFPLTKGQVTHYIPEWTGKVDLTNGKTKENGVLKDHVYTFGKSDFQNNAPFTTPKTFKGSQKVEEITKYIKDTFFTNSTQPIIKSLFGVNGTWDVKVVSRTWPGNIGANYFISDWIENLGHRTNYFYYFVNKKDATQTFYMKHSTSLSHPKEGN